MTRSSERSPVMPRGDGAVIEVLVHPRASRNEIADVHDGALRVRVAAPPVDGAANAAVITLFCKTLGVPRSAVEITHGHNGRRKRLLVHGVAAREARASLGLVDSTSGLSRQPHGS